MTQAGNNTHLLLFVQNVNEASGGLVASLALLSIFFIILVGLMRQNPPPESFLAASTVSTIVSLIFLFVELVSIIWVIGFTLIWSASAIALYRSNSV